MSGGFGVSSDSPLLGGLWLTLVLLPLPLSFAAAREHNRNRNRNRNRASSQHWAALGLTAAVLAGLAATSLARAHLGADEAKASRYSELAFTLLPMSAVAWSLLLADFPRWRRRALIALCSLAAFASIDDWTTLPYRLQKVAREGGVTCARHYYESGSPGVCPTIANRPIPLELARARELEIHFYRELNLSKK